MPGSEGDFGVLAGHAPLVALLRPGILTVYAGGEQTKIVVLGGFAEVGPDGLTVLADVATSVEDLDRAALQTQIAEMEQGIKDMEQGSALDQRDRAARSLQGAGSAPARHGDALSGRASQAAALPCEAAIVFGLRDRLTDLANFENSFTTRS